MDVLQGDIDALEQEKTQLTKKLDHQSKKAIAGIMGPRYTASKNLICNICYSTYCVCFIGDTVAAFMSGLGQASSRGVTPSSAAASHASGSAAGGAGGTIVLKDSPQLTTKV